MSNIIDHFQWDLEKENRLDPDDANTWTCSACLLPIFATPFKTIDQDGETQLVHDQCTDESLPPSLKRHPMHPKRDLVLCHLEYYSSPHSCNGCQSKCGSRFYGRECGFSLCLVCAGAVKVLHKSHMHRLTVIRRRKSLSFLCDLCKTQHPPQDNLMVLQAYACTDCDFWIHPDCAVLPNAIIIKARHPHPLLLVSYSAPYGGRDPRCHICRVEIIEAEYQYACDCSGPYCAHVKCAIYSRPDRFEKVLIRDAKIPDLLSLPLEDEKKSVMLSIIKNSTKLNFGTIVGRMLYSSKPDRAHKHPLIRCNHEDGKNIARVCNFCIQLIGPSDPFYTCAKGDDDNSGRCKYFFLHDCCAHLPRSFSPFHRLFSNMFTSSLYGTPFLFVRNLSTPFNIFTCKVCKCMCNGPAYSTLEDIIDVVCAAMVVPALITHEAHGKAHILQGMSTRETATRCNCCLEELPNVNYMFSCITCSSFSIHPDCALHPAKVSHKFDRHPLKLITGTGEDGDGHHHHQEEEITLLCEICENEIDRNIWRYGCDKCNQSFHVRCIPCRDHLSKIKFGFPVRVSCHSCPVTCVRAHSVDGYLCEHCGRAIRESDGIAFECSECYFRMHKVCVEEKMINTTSYNSD